MDVMSTLVYYLPGTSGWGATFAGMPTLLWNPQAPPQPITTLYSFTGGIDGGCPRGSLLFSGNTLYGTTCAWEKGTVFAVNSDGTGFRTLHAFTSTSNQTNDDGANPFAGLALVGDTFYGTTQLGGNWGNGTVFKINTDGTGFTTLHSFTGILDGNGPATTLMLLDNTLYGTALAGGTGTDCSTAGSGTVFALNTDGTGFRTLCDFAPFDYGGTLANCYGANPEGVILSGNTLYGTTSNGGSGGYGTVFRLLLEPVSPPQLSIALFETSLVLTWPNYISGLALPCTTNLLSGVWNTVFAAPVLINGQNAITISLSAPQQFYRLTH
jgi:uncharacterized repeat protein (TIGR03803 family)